MKKRCCLKTFKIIFIEFVAKITILDDMNYWRTIVSKNINVLEKNIGRNEFADIILNYVVVNKSI